jgi:rhodanese-related sulfurtransferase
MKTFQDLVDLNENIVFISNEGEISSILANGFVEQLGATNMHSLKGGIQQLIKENYQLSKN